MGGQVSLVSAGTSESVKFDPGLPVCRDLQRNVVAWTVKSFTFVVETERRTGAVLKVCTAFCTGIALSHSQAIGDLDKPRCRIAIVIQFGPATKPRLRAITPGKTTGIKGVKHRLDYFGGDHVFRIANRYIVEPEACVPIHAV